MQMATTTITTRDASGNAVRETRDENGQLQGARTVSVSNGTVIREEYRGPNGIYKEIVRDKDGNLVYEKNLKDGELDGVQKNGYSNGVVTHTATFESASNAEISDGEDAEH